jgi:transcriptional/translational regulatory protein YebC/TACO1
MVEATHPDKNLDAEEAAIEVGAQEVEKAEEGSRFICEKTDLVTVTKGLTDRGWHVSASEFVYLPKDPVEPSTDAMAEITPFLNDIDDNDDVHRIFTALKR